MNGSHAGRQRRIDVQQWREFFVFHRDVVERLLRAQLVFSDHGSHRLAQKANLADCEQRMILHSVAVIRADVLKIVRRTVR